MLNPKTKQRELAYVVNIDRIEPIVGSDNCEAAVVGGWRVMTRKGTFQAGDKAVYFEIDSKVPETETFAFLAPKHYKVKTQKYTFGGKGLMISQGLLMSFEDFGWELDKYNVGDFLTEILGVKYSVIEDNKRKASIDKYKRMAQRHYKLFKTNKIVQWLYTKTWGKKLLFLFLGNKRDKKAAFWPSWVVKTDEERVQNLPQLFPPDDTEWFVTEKVDGTSTTFTMKRGHGFKKNEFYVCSRNVVFENPDKKCFYDTNVYFEMAERYDIEEVLKNLLEKYPNTEWVTIQGETYGPGIQKRDYSTSHHHFAAFNLIMSNTGRWNTLDMINELTKYDVPCVPVVHPFYTLPDTVEELLEYATGESKIDGGIREGIVFRSVDGTKSFKAVSNEYLLKYHS